MADDKKTLKFQMMMTPAEAEQLDDWMFTNRVRSRAEAIRRLWQLALHQGSQIDKVKGLVDWLGRGSGSILRQRAWAADRLNGTVSRRRAGVSQARKDRRGGRLDRIFNAGRNEDRR